MPIKELKLTIMLPPVTKKNSQQILRNNRTGAAFIAPSAKYRKYERDCGPFLKLQDGYMFRIDYPVNVKCIFYMPTRRRVDLTNLLEAADDILVKYGILADDNYTVVAGHDGSRVRFDKAHPRTEITISIMEENNDENI